MDWFSTFAPAADLLAREAFRVASGPSAGELGWVLGGVLLGLLASGAVARMEPEARRRHSRPGVTSPDADPR